jgi:hypothetical protein
VRPDSPGTTRLLGELSANDMPVRTKIGPVNRLAAAVLALVWAAVAVSGFVAAYVSGRWGMLLVALFALWYAGLWVRVVVQARLLTWSEIATPWRAR